MEFRPCIDIHNGKVKQIVGGSLTDQNDMAEENFVSEQDAGFYAEYYRNRGIKGGHIILLNGAESPYFEETRKQAELALRVYPGGLQVGGGITPENAKAYLEAGASHVIVTSYVFQNGRVDYANLDKMVEAVGKEHLVLDLSCRSREGKYYIVTDRWQKFTEEEVTGELLRRLASYCNEFLIHAVDVEGKASGIEMELVKILAGFNEIPVTYAGGVGAWKDIELLKELTGGRINVTIGSALSLFGGILDFDEVIRFLYNNN